MFGYGTFGQFTFHQEPPGEGQSGISGNITLGELTATGTLASVVAVTGAATLAPLTVSGELVIEPRKFSGALLI